MGTGPATDRKLPRGGGDHDRCRSRPLAAARASAPAEIAHRPSARSPDGSSPVRGSVAGSGADPGRVTVSPSTDGFAGAGVPVPPVVPAVLPPVPPVPPV